MPVIADTFSPEVAARALDAGARRDQRHPGGGDPEMLALVAERGCGYVLMHIEGPPRVDRSRRSYDDPVDAPAAAGSPSGSRRRSRAASPSEQIALDPGLDFDLSVDDDLEILRRLGELRELGRPLFVALSRKDFLGAVAGRLLGGAAPAGRARLGDRGGDRPRGRRGRRGAAPARRSALRRHAGRGRDRRRPRVTRDG